MTPIPRPGAGRTFSTCIPRVTGQLWTEPLTQAGKVALLMTFTSYMRSKGKNREPQFAGNQRMPAAARISSGFTLLEMLVVMTIILILASFAVPTYTTAIMRAREAVLRDDLYTMRHLIDEYTVDKQQPPSSLQDLVDAGYLRGGIPVDPMTRSSETWKVDIEDVPTSSDQAQSGVVDVHSGSDATALDGTHYSDW